MDIKIFTSHRIDFDGETVNDQVFVPVRCGAVFDDRKKVEMLGDDTGENISSKRESFCELTVLYWAWKNVDADYYGLCHYRRYLNFSDVKYKTDEYSNVLAKTIDKDSEQKFGLDKESVEKAIAGYDVVTAKAVNVAKFPEKCKSIKDHFSKTKYLKSKDLDIMLDIIKEKEPAYYETAVKYLNGKKGYFCLLFVMTKKMLDLFCNWLFPLLFELEKRIDTSLYSSEGIRTPGHIAERLFGIFIEYQKNVNGIRIKELQQVVFRNPQKKCKCLHKTEFDSGSTLPIVLSSNNLFLPMVSTTIQSLIDNSSSDHNYDIVVLTNDVEKNSVELIKRQIEPYHNFAVRFFNTVDIISDYKLQGTSNITIETYYRFLIQDVLPDYDKVLYLDCDLICKKEVAKLYEIDLGDYWIGAAKDPDCIGQMCVDDESLDYAYNVLKMYNPFDYFQAGVLLLNTKELRKVHSVAEWLKICSDLHFRYLDQDVLNACCEGHVLFFDMKWNMLIDCNNYRVPYLIKNAPNSISEQYFAARKNPNIIHYAGFQKPWNTVDCDMADEFWQYARKTPFYEKLCFLLMNSSYINKQSHKKALVEWFKDHTPKWLRPFARKIKRKLGW